MQLSLEIFFLILLPIIYLDLARFKIPEITFWIVFLVIIFFTQIGYRFIIKDLINNLIKRKSKKNQKKSCNI